MLWALQTRGESPRHSLYRGLSGPQSHCWISGVEKFASAVGSRYPVLHQFTDGHKVMGLPEGRGVGEAFWKTEKIILKLILDENTR